MKSFKNKLKDSDVDDDYDCERKERSESQLTISSERNESQSNEAVVESDSSTAVVVNHENLIQSPSSSPSKTITDPAAVVPVISYGGSDSISGISSSSRESFSHSTQLPENKLVDSSSVVVHQESSPINRIVVSSSSSISPSSVMSHSSFPIQKSPKSQEGGREFDPDEDIIFLGFGSNKASNNNNPCVQKKSEETVSSEPIHVDSKQGARKEENIDSLYDKNTVEKNSAEFSRPPSDIERTLENNSVSKEQNDEDNTKISPPVHQPKIFDEEKDSVTCLDTQEDNFSDLIFPPSSTNVPCNVVTSQYQSDAVNRPTSINYQQRPHRFPLIPRSSPTGEVPFQPAGPVQQQRPHSFHFHPHVGFEGKGIPHRSVIAHQYQPPYPTQVAARVPPIPQNVAYPQQSPPERYGHSPQQGHEGKVRESNPLSPATFTTDPQLYSQFLQFNQNNPVSTKPRIPSSVPQLSTTTSTTPTVPKPDVTNQLGDQQHNYVSQQMPSSSAYQPQPSYLAGNKMMGPDMPRPVTSPIFARAQNPIIGIHGPGQRPAGGPGPVYDNRRIMMQSSQNIQSCTYPVAQQNQQQTPVSSFQASTSSRGDQGYSSNSDVSMRSHPTMHGQHSLAQRFTGPGTQSPSSSSSSFSYTPTCHTNQQPNRWMSIVPSPTGSPYPSQGLPRPGQRPLLQQNYNHHHHRTPDQSQLPTPPGGSGFHIRHPHPTGAQLLHQQQHTVQQLKQSEGGGESGFDNHKTTAPLNSYQQHPQYHQGYQATGSIINSQTPLHSTNNIRPNVIQSSPANNNNDNTIMNTTNNNNPPPPRTTAGTVWPVTYTQPHQRHPNPNIRVPNIMQSSQQQYYQNQPNKSNSSGASSYVGSNSSQSSGPFPVICRVSPLRFRYEQGSGSETYSQQRGPIPAYNSNDSGGSISCMTGSNTHHPSAYPPYNPTHHHPPYSQLSPQEFSDKSHRPESFEGEEFRGSHMPSSYQQYDAMRRLRTVRN